MRKGSSSNRGRKPVKKEGKKTGGESLREGRARRQELARLCAEWHRKNEPGERIPKSKFERLKAEAGLL